jgi:hypothetical protein
MMSELRCLRGVRSKPLVCATLDDATLASLEAARKTYGGVTGKSVTRSVVIRRAVRLLSQHLANVNSPAKEQRELAELLMVR